MILGHRWYTRVVGTECVVCVNDGVQPVGLFHFMRSLYNLKWS